MRQRPDNSRSPVTIEGYDVHERIGSGGFSSVYRAYQHSMGRQVAIKVLNIGFATDEEQRIFERECHALGRLSHHPNIVTVFSDAMTSDQRPCLVMELYDRTYRERIAESGRIPVEEVLSVGVRICGALQAAHDAGIVHRDVKPHNVFLSAYGEPALGDFGISTIDDERSQSGGGSLSIAYAAPEILEDGRPTAVADVYSLGATLFQLVEGSSPFASADMKTAVRRILTEDPPALTNPDAPASLQRVLHRVLSKDPAVRPQSATEFAEALREVQARAGLGHTAIPRLSLADPPVPPTVPSPSSASTSPASGPVPVGPSSVDDADSEVGSVTIARPEPAGSSRRRLDATEPDDVSTTPPWRRWVGPAVLIALVAAVVAGVVVAQRSDGGTNGGGADGPVTTSTVPDDPIFESVLAPTEVEVVSIDGGFEVSFTPGTGAASTEIEVVGGGSGGGTGRLVETEQSVVTVDSDAATLCVELRSLGERGRVSPTVGPICSG